MLSLRDTLLNSLKSLPGSREFHIHALVSAPRRTQELFPYAIPRPKTWVQEIFILVSEQPNPGAPRVFVTAVEAYFYMLPATSSGVLYVSKVDSTGQGQKPSPTGTTVRALLQFYLDPDTRPSVGGQVEKVWVHVFARAQNQYLFPNSSDFEGKKPLSDIKLCGWWKAVLGSVALQLKEKGGDAAERLKLWYLLPGLSDLEALRALNPGSGASRGSSVDWIYGHPYANSKSEDIPLPCPVDGYSLGHFIPSFEDDPKSRFLDEIAHTSESDVVRSPARKKSKKGREEDVSEKKEGGQVGELAKVTPEEYWERMSFRQECVAGVVTGFFVLGYSTKSRSNPTTAKVSIFAPQPGHVSSNITRRVVSSLMTAHEFSTVERAVRGTETLEEAIKGLCEGIDGGETDALVNRNKTPEPADCPPLAASSLAPRTPPRNTNTLPDISPNPFPEPTASLETYSSWIYGSVCVDNPLVSSGPLAKLPEEPTQKVTVLAVRKKKRKLD